MLLELSFTQLNWISHMIALVGVLLLCWPTFWLVKVIRKFEAHQPIDLAQVQTVRVFDSDPPREATPEEIRQLVEWFNQAAFIQKREPAHPQGEGAGVAIQLRSGEEIWIVPRGGDFDVIRRRANNRIVAYWARQRELGHFLARHSA